MKSYKSPQRMETFKPKTQCVLYVRKSTEEDDRQIMSIEAQLFELQEFARREHIEIVKVFTESKSAKTPGREQFAKMLANIAASREQLGILAWHPFMQVDIFSSLLRPLGAFKSLHVCGMNMFCCVCRSSDYTASGRCGMLARRRMRYT